MSYRFKLTNGNAILNFSEEYAHTPIQLINSEGYTKMLKAFIEEGRIHEDDAYLYLHRCNEDDTLLVKDMKDMSRLLTIMTVDEIKENYEQYAKYFESRDMLYNIIEKIYLFWRRHQRYAVVLIIKNKVVVFNL